MFGYACDDTPDLMPMPIWLAHRLARRLAEVRKDGTLDYLRPDGKTQVSIDYEDGVAQALSTVLISSQHAPGIDIDGQMKADLIEHVIRPTLPEQFADDDFEVLVNPTGAFELGGPHADCGLTGRKIIVDTYGGMARHGGGAFSGKDPTKVDRSAAYAVRNVAKNVVAAGHREPLRGAGRVRDRRRAPGLDDGRDVRHVGDRPGEAARPAAGALRPASRRDHRAARPAPADLPQHRGVRPLRALRARLHVGAHRRRRRPRQPREGARVSERRQRHAYARVCRVQPDVPAIHRAFDYALPDALARDVRVGTIVRVPLHGRRVRGWVLDADVAAPEVEGARLRDVLAVVSAGPAARRRRPVSVGGVALGGTARHVPPRGVAAERRARRRRTRASRPRCTRRRSSRRRARRS